MANQFNRLAYLKGKGGFLRIIWKPNIASEAANLVVLPHSTYALETDPHLENMTEGDSKGHYYAPGTEDHTLRVNLRRRQDPVSLDALGIRGLGTVDRVLIDIGNSGTCDVYDHMTVGPYNREAPQIQNITEGFSLHGGEMVGQGIAIPFYARLSGTIPDITAYIAVGGAVPSGL